MFVVFVMFVGVIFIVLRFVMFLSNVASDDEPSADNNSFQLFNSSDAGGDKYLGSFKVAARCSFGFVVIFIFFCFRDVNSNCVSFECKALTILKGSMFFLIRKNSKFFFPFLQVY
jgi:hypothetical protein